MLTMDFGTSMAITGTGATDFRHLTNAIRKLPEAKYTFGVMYNPGHFGIRSMNFNEKAGYRKNPLRNDIMFDTSLEDYVQYNGKTWQEVRHEDFNRLLTMENIYRFGICRRLSSW